MSGEGESNAKSGGGGGANLANVPKTPVSLLQELYVRKGITPKYDLVQIEGAVHEPTFKYRVSVGEVVATGCGASKKKAKHEAAKNILTKLKAAQQRGYFESQAKASEGATPPDHDSQNSATAVAPGPLPGGGHKGHPASLMKDVELPDLDTDLMSPYDDGISGNPVGELQEICMNRRMQPPVYEVSLEEGAPHERNFVINCLVGSKFRESGCGKSKKLAKRKAASKMLATLKSQPVLVDDNDPALGGVGANLIIDEDELVQGIAHRAAIIKQSQAAAAASDQTASAADDNGLMQVSKFYRNLKKSKGTKLAGLQETTGEEFEANADSYKLLDALADEQGFSLTYVDVEERSKSGKFHCFVQLATNPVAVCFGVGVRDAKDARYDAAKNALEYLRIMTK